MDIDFDACRRRQLERKAVSAALELLAFAGAAAILLPVPGTNPRIFLAIGDVEQIQCGLESAASDAAAGG